MSKIVKSTICDLRAGRESWRVFFLVCTPASATAILLVSMVQ